MLSTTPTPQNRASRACVRGLKTRVWGFCRRPATRAPVFGLQTTKPRRVAKATATKTASGPSHWLSRDPLYEIEKRLPELLPEGPNIYGFIGNNPVGDWDYLGLIAGGRGGGPNPPGAVGPRRGGPGAGGGVSAFKKCGTKVSRAIDPDNNPFIANLGTGCCRLHQYIITQDGQHLDNGGSGGHENHWSAIKESILIPVNSSCEEFTECVKKDLQERAAKGYHWLKNNCMDFTNGAIKKCGGRT